MCDTEQVDLDLVTVFRAIRDRFETPSVYTLRIVVEPGTQFFRRSDRLLLGDFTTWDKSHRVINFRTVEGTVSIGSLRDGVTGIVDLVHDAVHQIGTTPSFTPDDILAAIEAE